MANPNFDWAFDLLMGHEGGYSNNPKDPGGETMWGVTKRVARSWGYQGEMRNLPRETAKQIAKKWYWDPLRCDDYHKVIAYQLFDTLYNGGHTVIWAQAASGAKVDGIFGPETARCLKQCFAPSFCIKFNVLRLLYLTSLKTWGTFGKGWARRVAKNLALGAPE